MPLPSHLRTPCSQELCPYAPALSPPHAEMFLPTAQNCSQTAGAAWPPLQERSRLGQNPSSFRSKAVQSRNSWKLWRDSPQPVLPQHKHTQPETQ